MNREKLKQQIIKNFEDAEITEKERLTNVMQCVDAHIKQLSIHGVVNRRELLCDDCNKQSKYIAILCKECYLKDSEL